MHQVGEVVPEILPTTNEIKYVKAVTQTPLNI